MVSLKARVNQMHLMAGMSNKPHHVCLGKAALVTASNKSNSATMETKVLKLNSAEETPPSFSGHGGHVECSYTPLSRQLMYKGHKLWAERELSKLGFVSLCPESDYTSLDVYVPEGKASLTEATPLMPSDVEANAHPVRLSLQSCHNLLVLGLSYTRFLRGGVGPNAESAARVRRRKVGRKGFVHDYAKQLNFVKGSVLAGFVAALISVPLLTPVHEVPDMRSRQLPWHKYFLDPQERRDIAPDTLIPGKRVRGMRVALTKEAGNKVNPPLTAKLKPGLFLLRHMIDNLMRSGSIELYTPTVFSGALLAYSVYGVNELQPPVRGTFALVERSHCTTLYQNI